MQCDGGYCTVEGIVSFKYDVIAGSKRANEHDYTYTQSDATESCYCGLLQNKVSFKIHFVFSRLRKRELRRSAKWLQGVASG